MTPLLSFHFLIYFYYIPSYPNPHHLMAAHASDLSYAWLCCALQMHVTICIGLCTYILYAIFSDYFALFGKWISATTVYCRVWQRNVHAHRHTPDHVSVLLLG